MADHPETIGPERDTKFLAVQRTTQYLSMPPALVQDKLAEAKGLLDDSENTRQRILELLAKVDK
ncbi:hypothetical protein [Ruegeria atlantica]|uniref:hypothetical protein n=1 Tax=Ruegeria atlantica TaxID=81569 RepID=UPI00071E5E0D|nr:hypothetical protein [Ruegeria atlantica]